MAHDLNFSLGWAVASTLIIWASPAQVVLLSTLGAGASPLQAAIAVSLSGVRLLPMVVSVLPVMRQRDTRLRELVLPAHFTAVTFWVESQRILPSLPRARRIAFANGLGTGLCLGASLATGIGYLLAVHLPALLASGVLFLAPITFLLTISRNSQRFTEWLAIVLGLVFAPLAARLNTGVDLLIGGVAAGTIAYAVQRVRRGV
ncbi:MAG: branched-chain amino acid ABC transporter permease [Xanthobacteraceae bacterium]|nr:MAG: branched-chain amino acid ABC transporter permease [Xanthobacteraceae bacterium]